MVKELTVENFEEEVINSELPLIIDFFADWCGPCQMMGPIIEEVAKEIEGRARVGKLNVDENAQTAQRFSIMSIPTLIIFKNGQVVKQLVGVQAKRHFWQS